MEQRNNKFISYRDVRLWISIIVPIITTIVTVTAHLSHKLDTIEFNQVLRDTVINNRFDQQNTINQYVNSKLREHDSELKTIQQHYYESR